MSLTKLAVPIRHSAGQMDLDATQWPNVKIANQAVLAGPKLELISTELIAMAEFLERQQ